VIDFVMKLERGDLPGGRSLARRARGDRGRRGSQRGAGRTDRLRKQKDDLYNANQVAAHFYEEQLAKVIAGVKLAAVGCRPTSIRASTCKLRGIVGERLPEHQHHEHAEPISPVDRCARMTHLHPMVASAAFNKSSPSSPSSAPTNASSWRPRSDASNQRPMRIPRVRASPTRSSASCALSRASSPRSPSKAASIRARSQSDRPAEAPRRGSRRDPRA
jgi:hypothetical protein